MINFGNLRPLTCVPVGVGVVGLVVVVVVVGVVVVVIVLMRSLFVAMKFLIR